MVLIWKLNGIKSHQHNNKHLELTPNLLSLLVYCVFIWCKWAVALAQRRETGWGGERERECVCV